MTEGLHASALSHDFDVYCSVNRETPSKQMLNYDSIYITVKPKCNSLNIPLTKSMFYYNLLIHDEEIN